MEVTPTPFNVSRMPPMSAFLRKRRPGVFGLARHAGMDDGEIDSAGWYGVARVLRLYGAMATLTTAICGAVASVLDEANWRLAKRRRPESPPQSLDTACTADGTPLRQCVAVRADDGRGEAVAAVGREVRRAVAAADIPPVGRLVVQAVFGLNGMAPLTLTEVARLVGLDFYRTRAALAAALDAIRPALARAHRRYCEVAE
jgi:hypothetical protein